ncbi:methyltransferase type 11 [Haloprofundus marisrubri]|uniref:Methyltransferase type 11 n=1 Tax=Haloprofundus marisrubri TaxID=1514971 RepID=A0A0W1R4F5_9EURY|nr:methyltransferase domain-containing protein [Haloprofundus marisrubri]KTG08195.1 methyltransferase type 11 [Haloprofundus marisrubri]
MLSAAERSKLDTGDDARFYDSPRFVHHVDERFRERLTELYRDELTADSVALDLMSSWVSHLPDDVDYERVVGHGLNRAELAENPRLDEFFVGNLNETPSLPMETAVVDAVLVAVSVQYLQRPGAVFAEIRRVLRPGGVCVVSFSNRMFAQKAIRAWRATSMDGRAALVRRYFEGVGGFEDVRVVSDVDSQSDPFYAVVARRTSE